MGNVCGKSGQDGLESNKNNGIKVKGNKKMNMGGMHNESGVKDIELSFSANGLVRTGLSK